MHRNIYVSRGFEPTIPVFERKKTVHALDRSSTVIGQNSNYIKLFVIVINDVIYEWPTDRRSLIFKLSYRNFHFSVGSWRMH
jgi:hypothetical protein